MGAQRRQLNVGCPHPIIKKQAHCSCPWRLIFLEAAGQSVISPKEASKDDASDRDAGVIAETGADHNGCGICRELVMHTI